MRRCGGFLPQCAAGQGAKRRSLYAELYAVTPTFFISQAKQDVELEFLSEIYAPTINFIYPFLIITLSNFQLLNLQSF